LGCLGAPRRAFFGTITRPGGVGDDLDERGVACSLAAEDDFSELVQHELDHLDGVPAIDRAIDKNSFAFRAEFERRYREQQVVPL